MLSVLQHNVCFIAISLRLKKTQNDDPEEESPPPEEVQHKLLEVATALQSL